MTIEHLALAIGAFLIMVIWIKLRSMNARLRKMQKALEEFRILYDRLFMAAMMQKGVKSPPAEVISLVPPANPVETEQRTSAPKIVR